VRARGVAGQHTGPGSEARRRSRAGAAVPSTAAGAGPTRLGAPPRALTPGDHQRPTGPAAPVRVPCGGRRLRSARVPLAARLPLERRVACAQGIDRARPLRRADGQRVARALGVRHAGERRLARRRGPSPHARGCRAGPRALGRAALRVGGAVAGARGGCGPWDESALGHDSLAPGEAGAVLPRSAPAHTPTRAAAGNGWSSLQGLRLGRLGRLDAGQRDGAAPRRRGGHQGEGACDTRLHGGRRAPGRHPVPVRLVGQRRPARGQVGRAGGLLDVRAARGALTGQLEAAPEPVAGGPPRGGRAVGRRAPPATPQHGEVLGGDRVVVGLAAVDRVLLPRRPADTGQRCRGAAVGAPGPGQATFDRADQSRTRGGHGLENRVGSRLQMPVQPALPLLIPEAEGQGASGPVEATITRVLLGVESPEVSSSSGGGLPNASIPRWSAEQGASISITGMPRMRRLVASR
jgi:hypothetical protein